MTLPDPPLPPVLAALVECEALPPLVLVATLPREPGAIGQAAAGGWLAYLGAVAISAGMAVSGLVAGRAAPPDPSTLRAPTVAGGAGERRGEHAGVHVTTAGSVARVEGASEVFDWAGDLTFDRGRATLNLAAAGNEDAWVRLQSVAGGQDLVLHIPASPLDPVRIYQARSVLPELRSSDEAPFGDSLRTIDAAAAGASDVDFATWSTRTGLDLAGDVIPAVERTLARVARGPASSDAADVSQWLGELERVRRAGVAIDAGAKMAGPLAGLASRIAAAVRDGTAVAREMPTSWVYGRQFPQIVLTGVQRGAFEGPPAEADADLVVRRWAGSALHGEDSARVRELALRPGAWQDAYRRWLAARTAPLTVAPDLPEGTLLRLRMPHLPGDGRVEISRKPDGTLEAAWAMGSARVPIERAPDGSFVFGDPVTGWLVVAVTSPALPELPRLRLEVSQLESTVAGRGDAQLRGRVAAALHDGPLAEAALSAARAFAEGEDGEDDDEEWLALALRARIALGRAASGLDDPKLLERLAAIDQRLRPVGPALLLIAPEDYAHVVGDQPVDLQSWWGFRARADRVLPDPALDDVLRELPERA